MHTYAMSVIASNVQLRSCTPRTTRAEIATRPKRKY
jgi:hypothetical protein